MITCYEINDFKDEVSVLILGEEAIRELLALAKLLDEPEQSIRQVVSRLLDLPFALNVGVAHILHVFHAHSFNDIHL